MKSNALLKSIMIVCAILLISGVALSVKTIIGFADLADADQYTAGDASITGPVQNLDIGWASGTINIAYHKENTVTLTETAKKPISSDMRMCWWLDGDTLRVRYAKPKIYMISTQSKELTVTLPENTVFSSVLIDGASGTVNIPALNADELTLDVTSGDIYAAVNARKIHIGTTSGHMELIADNTEEINASSTSGDVFITADHADYVAADTTSGVIDCLIGEAEKISADSTSGSVRVDTGKAGELDIESTSGDVTLSVPEDFGFTAKIDTTSGKIEYELPLAKQGNSYVNGDGSANVDLSATSGNIKIKVLK